MKRFKSTRTIFNRKNDAFIDLVTGNMAQDIERAAKLKVPVKTGDLQSSIKHYKTQRGTYRIEANKEYAAYQERGMRRDGSHQVKRYTTPGTGKQWFKGAINKAISHKKAY